LHSLEFIEQEEIDRRELCMLGLASNMKLFGTAADVLALGGRAAAAAGWHQRTAKYQAKRLMSGQPVVWWHDVSRIRVLLLKVKRE
jgi:hypothetical protein